MPAPHQGRQSPPPSRQTGPQERSVPGWSGKAEQKNGGQALRNPAGHTEDAVPATRGSSFAPVRMESNPQHPLEEISHTKSGSSYKPVEPSF